MPGRVRAAAPGRGRAARARGRPWRAATRRGGGRDRPRVSSCSSQDSSATSTLRASWPRIDSLERPPALQIAARQRPGALERRPCPLPEQHAEPLRAHLEHHGERDVRRRAALRSRGRFPTPSRRLWYPAWARFSIIKQKPVGGHVEMKPIELPTLSPGALGAEEATRLQDEVRALARGAERGDPRAQLPGARGAGRGALRGGLARPLPQGGERRRRRDRLLRRALHGRDGLDPVAGQDRAAARPRRRLLARRLDHGRRRCAPGRPSTPARSSSCT